MRFLMRFFPYVPLALVVLTFIFINAQNLTELPITENNARLVQAGFSYLNFTLPSEEAAPPIPAMLAAIGYVIWDADSAIFIMLVIALALLLTTYFSAVFVMGRSWGLVPTTFLAFSPLLQSPSISLMAPLTFLLSLVLLALFLLSPTRTRGAILGLSLIFAIGSNFQNVILIPMVVILVIIAGIAGFWLGFGDLNPEGRRNALYLRIVRYGMPLMVMAIVSVPPAALLGFLLPQITLDANDFLVFIAENPALNPIARYINFLLLAPSNESFLSNLIQTLSLPAFLAISFGALLGSIAALTSLARSLGRQILNPALAFIETRSLELAYLGGIIAVIFWDFGHGMWGAASVASPLLILTAGALKSWCLGKSAYFSGGIRVNISAFDQRVSNSGIKYGVIIILLALQIFIN